MPTPDETQEIEVQVRTEPARFSGYVTSDEPFERTQMTMRISSEQTLADVVGAIIAASHDAMLGKFYAISFVAPVADAEHEVGEVYLREPNGRARLPADPTRMSFDGLLRAYSSGWLSGDPRHIVVRAETPSALVGGVVWDTFVEAIRLFWE